MTHAEKRVFLTDMRYVLRQAQAYRQYKLLRSSGSLLISHPFVETMECALLESSLSFLRKVNEFFGKSGVASVRAFFPDYPVAWLWGRSDCDLLNDRVMHLSIRHATEGEFDWTDFLNTHLPEAEARFQAFFERVEKEYPELLNYEG